MNEKSTKLVLILVLFSLVLLSPKSYGQLASGHEKFIGNVLSFNGVPTNFDFYWNQVSPENNGKWQYVEGTRDSYSWFRLDEIYNYARERGFPFRFHTLVWGQQSPTWIPGNLSLEEQAEEVEEWIRLVGERYPDMDFVDVVNEPLPGHAPALYREALGGAGTTGWDWVIRVFELARQYIPNAELHLNEYNILNSSGNTTTYLQIINLLKERNLIDGIGIQGHRFELENASASTIQSNLDRLAETGLPIYLTEFDIGNISDAGTPNDAQQLEIYQRVFPLLWEHPAVKGITFWGYIQGQVWQETSFLIRSDGTERPAMQWLRDYLTLEGTFRSFQSGNWNDVNTWEQYNGSEWVHPTPGIPKVSDNTLSILDGHTITVTTSDSTDQLTIAPEGKLVINPGVTFLVKNGNGTDITVNGSIENYGSVTVEDSASVRFLSTGKYIHKQNGGSIPTAIWGEGSICQFDSVKTTAPSNGNQDFYNIIWNCPGQTSNLNLGWNGNTIGGDITVISTGTARWQMCAPTEGNSATVTINGDIIQTGGQFTTNGTSNGNTTIVINHYGDINISGGNFSISRGSQGGTGTTVWNIANGNFTMMNATTQNSNSSGAKFVFSGSNQALTLGSGNTLTSLPIEVSSATTLDIGASALEGSGIFVLNPGATLATAHQNGVDAIQVTGVKSLSSEADYIFNGTDAQVTGNSLPDTVNNLILSNNAGITLSKSITVNGIVDVKRNGFSRGGHELIYGTEKTLRYSGTIAQTTNDAEFPSEDGPVNLLINNTTGVTLHASRIITGSLELSGKLFLDSNDLTAGTATSAGLTRYVVTSGTGSLKLIDVGTSETLFPVGTSTAYAPLWVTNTGTADTIGVNLESDTSPAPEGGRVRTKWNISEGTAGGGNYTLQFGWVTTLEDAAFRNPSREENAFIFNLTDTTEAGTGEYTMQFTTQPYTISRSGISTLGPFAVGKFSTVTELNEENENLPIKFNLSQNFPNPFNPTTTIRYTLSEPSKAKVVIYNVLGVKVRTLADSFHSAGEHLVEWDAKDDNDNPVSSGVYFYSLETGDKKLQKKMMLIR